MNIRYLKRQHALRSVIRREKLNAYLTDNLFDIRYLTGFSGSNALLVAGPRRMVFLTDFRYQEQIKREVTADRRIIIRRTFIQELAARKLLSRVPAVGFPEDKLTYAVYRELYRAFPDIEWTPVPSLVRQLRLVKDAREIACLKKAIDCTQKAFTKVLPSIRPGIPEMDIAAEIEYHLKKEGCQSLSFPTIVASGTRSALPHGAASGKKIKKGDLVVMDFGGTYQGYCGDFTRTVVVGRATARQKKVYNAVLAAQKEALGNVRAGLDCRQLDARARSIINKAGFGRYFGHGLGHGVGLEVHEPPIVSQKSQETLAAGMVHSIEPGIYIPGLGGVRIEDVVVVSKNGCINLTKAKKDLIEL